MADLLVRFRVPLLAFVLGVVAGWYGPSAVESLLSPPFGRPTEAPVNVPMYLAPELPRFR